jgi:hypothetical protein
MNLRDILNNPKSPTTKEMMQLEMSDIDLIRVWSKQNRINFLNSGRKATHETHERTTEE